MENGIMSFIRIDYDSSVNDCRETVIARKLTPTDAITCLNSVKFPAYISCPELVNTEAYFMMYAENEACKNEYAKIID